MVILQIPPPALNFKAVLEPKQVGFGKSSVAEPFLVQQQQQHGDTVGLDWWNVKNVGLNASLLIGAATQKQLEM